METIGRTNFNERTIERVACYSENFKKSTAHYSESPLIPLCKHDIPLLGCDTKKLMISTHSQSQSAKSEHPSIIRRVMMGEDDCYSGREEYNAFMETQAPHRRCIEGSSRHPQHETVRVGEPSASRNAEEIYEN